MKTERQILIEIARMFFYDTVTFKELKKMSLKELRKRFGP